MKNLKNVLFPLLIFAFFVTSCDKKENEKTKLSSSLKNKFGDEFYIGAAINDGVIDESDTLALKLLNQEFNSITAENIMKWMYVHPEKETFYFDASDRFVALGEKNNMHIVGHTLIWHSQLAPWMNEIKDSSDMADHIKNHIDRIAGRYKGRIDSWDVVNEALNEDGTYRKSIFYEVLGDEYIDLAFRTAAKADPNAELVYNDYNLWKPEKRAGVVKMVKHLQGKGTKIDGIGMQAHWSLVGPSLEDIENSILAYAELGVKVMFTELDITAIPNPWDIEGAEVSQDYKDLEGSKIFDPYQEELPDSIQVKLAKRYEEIFRLFLKHQDKISRVTFWGINDGGSWLNNWPIKGRTNYPLLFDRNFQPKKAYKRVIEIQ